MCNVHQYTKKKEFYKVKINIILFSPLARNCTRVVNFPEARSNKERVRSRNTCIVTLVIMHERRGNRILKYAKQRPMLRESKSLNPSKEFYFRLYMSASVAKFRIE